MKKSSGMLRSVLIAGVAISMAGCSGMLSGDPFKEEVAEDADNSSLSYSISRRIITGLGGVSDDNRKKINYKPRAPLAVPPAMVLKEPENKTDVTSEMANWPKENDEAKDYLAAREAEKTYRERTRDDWENPVVPGREMARNRVIGGGQIADPNDNTDPERTAPTYTQDQADQFAEDIGKLKTAQADGVAKRKYLTEPPATYRTPAGGAKLPSSVKIEPESKHDDWENPAGF